MSTSSADARSDASTEAQWSDIAAALWSRLPSLILIQIALIVLTFVQLRQASPVYEVTTVLASGSNQPEMTGGGLSQLAGLVTGANTGKLNEFSHLLISPTIVKILEERYGLIDRLLVSRNPGFMQRLRALPGRTARILAGRDPDRTPTVEDLTQYLQSKVILTNEKGGLLSITMEHGNPEFAAWLLNTMVAETDNYMKAIDRAAAETKTASMQALLNSFQKASQREFAVALMESHFNQLVVTHSEAPYVVKILEPAAVPDGPSGPRISTALITHFFFGIVIWLGYVAVRTIGFRINRLRRS